ncbi:hypothetical protein AB8A20_11850 [Tardiphaga sp. 604_B6_N1_1]|uniref:hypothetical protein n=1 Tax=unclassified Tardiphaga TaxID=2631404 RepID=UPI003F23F9B5
MASAKRAALGKLTGQRPEEEGQAVVTDYPASDRTRAAGVLEAIGLGSNQQALNLCATSDKPAGTMLERKRELLRLAGQFACGTLAGELH